jgi:hypothetical protein
MRTPHIKILLTLTVVITALLFCTLSFLTAKWLYVDSSLIQSPPTMLRDILVGTLTFLGGALLPAFILTLFKKKHAVRLAIFTAALALFFMALHGFFFMLFYYLPYWLYALVVEIGFIGLVVLFAAAKSRCCGGKDGCVAK